MDNYKKCFFIIASIFAILAISLLVQTYAKYVTSTNGITSIPIAKWNIVINNQSIKNNSNISSSIIPVFPGNDHIASNIIAPTAEGYFDLSFDFSNIDVSFSYEILTSVSSQSAVKDFVVTGYQFENGDIVTFKNFNEPIKEDILLSSNIKERKVRIFIKWNDEPTTSTMDNLADTSSTISDNSLAIMDVKISFTQLANTNTSTNIIDN